LGFSTGARLGPYEILAPLGAGGMGEVYRARDTRLGREVAVKVLPDALSADAGRLRRFENEARSASSLNHPNIVTVYDVGSSDSTTYIAMELVQGQTLRQLLLQGALPVKKVLGIATQVADGLAKAHSVGIVHRDLKPENVMVTRDGFAKILDFGLAKLAQPEGSVEGTQAPTLSEGTEPGTVVGTVAYMSPEQALGQPLDFRSDQFSFGSILYEMATGKRAFGRASSPETMTAIIRDEPVPVAVLAPTTPPPLRWIVERCLAKDSTERYASTQDLASELRTLRGHLSEATISAESIPSVRSALRSAIPIWIALLAAAAGLLAGRFLLTPRQSPPSYQRLTFRRGAVAAARFSSGSQAAVYSFSAGGEALEIYSKRIGSPESRDLGLSGAQLLSVSASGELAVALGWQWSGDKGGEGSGTLARVPLEGGAPRQLLERVIFADWAPDGKTLAVVRSGGTGRRIEFPPGKLLYEPRTNGIYQLRVSPRGDSVAFLCLDRPDGLFSVQIVDGTGKRRVLSEGWRDALGLAWSKDDEVWFTATKSGFTRSLYAATTSGKERLIARVPSGLILHDLAPGGRVLMTQELTRRETAGRLAGDTEDRDLSWLDYSMALDLSEDGRRLLFAEAGEGSGSSHSLWLREVDKPTPVRLGDGGSGSSVSPDSRWVAALQRVSSGANQLRLLPTGAGEARTVPVENVNAESIRWFPDGEHLLVSGVAHNGRYRSSVVELSGGVSHFLGREGDECDVISPDGRSILCRGESGDLVVYPEKEGESRALPLKLPRGWPMSFSSDGRAIFAATMGVPARILRFDNQTGQTNVWRELAPADLAGVRLVMPVSITPDGRFYTYTFRRVLSDLYLAEGWK